MRKIILIIAGLVMVAAMPLVSPALAETVVIKSGDRGHHRDRARGHRKVVVVNRHHDRGRHRGGYKHRAQGSKVIIKRD